MAIGISRRLGSRRVLAASLATGTLTLWLCPGSPPGAVMGDRRGPCPDHQRRVWFDPTWTPTEKGAFINGANSVWNFSNPEDWAPTKGIAGMGSGPPVPISVLEARELADLHDMEAYRADLDGSLYGYFECVEGSLAVLVLDRDVMVDGEANKLATVNAIGAHEVGHALGLTHTGAWREVKAWESQDDENAPIEAPVMATCLPGRPKTPRLFKTDAAQYYAGEGPGTSSLAFDPSLRDVTQGTWMTGGQVTKRAVSPEGRHGVILTSAVDGQPASVSQTMETWGLGGRAFRAGARFKKASPHVGSVTVKVEYRRLTAPPAAAGGCERGEYFDDLNLNAAPDQGAWAQCAEATQLVRNDGLPGSHPYSMAGACSYPKSWQGAEFRTSVWKNTDQAVFLDEVVLSEVAS